MSCQHVSSGLLQLWAIPERTLAWGGGKKGVRSPPMCFCDALKHGIPEEPWAACHRAVYPRLVPPTQAPHLCRQNYLSCDICEVCDMISM